MVPGRTYVLVLDSSSGHHLGLLGRGRALTTTHPGVVATKVRYFGVKSTNVPQGQMGTKPAKVAHLPSWPTKVANQAFSPRPNYRPFCK